MLDIRSVYLLKMRRGGGYKLGIAKNPNHRRANIDRDIPKRRILLVTSRRVCFSRDVEHRLHKMFKHRRYTLKNVGPQAGKTEWFRLSWLEVIKVRLMITYFGVIYWIFIFTTSIVILDIIILILC